jgi:hypothetical protein
MPPQNMPVQRLMVAMLSLDLSCSGLVTHSGEILTNDTHHKKKSDELLPTEDIKMKKFIRYYRHIIINNTRKEEGKIYSLYAIHCRGVAQRGRGRERGGELI